MNLRGSRKLVGLCVCVVGVLVTGAMTGHAVEAIAAIPVMCLGFFGGNVGEHVAARPKAAEVPAPEAKP